MERESFLKKLNELNLNKKEFANICKVPYSTVNAWGSTGNNGKTLVLPPWVEPFLNYYERAKKLEYVTNEICEKIKEIK